MAMVNKSNVEVISNGADLISLHEKLNGKKKRKLAVNIYLNQLDEKVNYKALNFVSENCTELKKVTVKSCFSNGEDLCNFLEALSKNPDKKSTQLDITENGHTEGCTEALVKLIKQRSLSSLKVSHEIPEDNLGRILTQIQESSKKFKHLSIINYDLSDTLFEKLLSLLKHKKIRKKLDLSGCTISEEQKKSLRDTASSKLFQITTQAKIVFDPESQFSGVTKNYEDNTEQSVSAQASSDKPSTSETREEFPVKRIETEPSLGTFLEEEPLSIEKIDNVLEETGQREPQHNLLPFRATSTTSLPLSTGNTKPERSFVPINKDLRANYNLSKADSRDSGVGESFISLDSDSMTASTETLVSKEEFEMKNAFRATSTTSLPLSTGSTKPERNSVPINKALRAFYNLSKADSRDSGVGESTNSLDSVASSRSSLINPLFHKNFNNGKLHKDFMAASTKTLISNSKELSKCSKNGEHSMTASTETLVSREEFEIKNGSDVRTTHGQSQSSSDSYVSSDDESVVSVLHGDTGITQAQIDQEEDLAVEECNIKPRDFMDMGAKFEPDLQEAQQSDYSHNQSEVINDDVIQKEFRVQIGSDGGDIELCDCLVTFPPGSFKEPTLVEGKLEIDPLKWPPGYTAITPMLFIKSEIPAKFPITVQMDSWCKNDCSNQKITVDILHLPDGKSEWEVIATQPLTSLTRFSFSSPDYSPFIIGLLRRVVEQFRPTYLLDCRVHTKPENSFRIVFNKRSRVLEEHLLKYNLGSLKTGFDTIFVHKNDRIAITIKCVNPNGILFCHERFDFLIDDNFLDIRKDKQFETYITNEATAPRRLEISCDLFVNNVAVQRDQSFMYTLDIERGNRKLKIKATDGSIVTIDTENMTIDHRRMPNNIEWKEYIKSFSFLLKKLSKIIVSRDFMFIAILSLCLFQDAISPLEIMAYIVLAALSAAIIRGTYERIRRLFR
uniref:uncharacterized protein LOC120341115 isoform X1 n=1 Tax=Styela clava TaxID=7725 RepID=UPI00193AC83B|nr:uncharacterized protein LOC120341115 isoform X1 [Styela clava]XP_039265491.1 uncharacterized protein LOC120341115 isoform X1 [Styela clava]